MLTRFNASAYQKHTYTHVTWEKSPCERERISYTTHTNKHLSPCSNVFVYLRTVYNQISAIAADNMSRQQEWRQSTNWQNYKKRKEIKAIETTKEEGSKGEMIRMWRKETIILRENDFFCWSLTSFFFREGICVCTLKYNSFRINSVCCLDRSHMWIYIYIFSFSNEITQSTHFAMRASKSVVSSHTQHCSFSLSLSIFIYSSRFSLAINQLCSR